MSKVEKPTKYCCGRLMKPVRRPTSRGFRIMWVCGICNERTLMNKEDWEYYRKRGLGGTTK